MSTITPKAWYDLAEKARWYDLQKTWDDARLEGRRQGVKPFHVCDNCGTPLLDAAIFHEMLNRGADVDASAFVTYSDPCVEKCASCDKKMHWDFEALYDA